MVVSDVFSFFRKLGTESNVCVYLHISSSHLGITARFFNQNKTPTNSASSHQCICPHGFTGKSCEIVSGGKESEATIIARDIMWMYLVILALGSRAVLPLVFRRYRSKSLLYENEEKDEENDDQEEGEEEEECVCVCGAGVDNIFG